MRNKNLASGVLLVLILSGCGINVPTDPNGTLDSVRGGTMRVGISPNGDFTIVGDNDTYSGSEVALIEEFAEGLDADIEWTVASEEALVRGLENDKIDLVAAGLTDATPWVEKAGVTRAYREITASDGSKQKLVMLTPLGENAFITELETFLSESGGE